MISTKWMLATVLVLGPVGGWALDITTCYVTVPKGETGVLQADLVCQPGDFHAVALEHGAALELNGHTVSNAAHFASGAAIRCFGRCRIAGPGLISGAPSRAFDAIRADGGVFPAPSLRLEVRDLTIDATHIGIEGNVGRGASVRATNVTITNSDLYGFYIPRIVAEDVTTTGNFIGLYGKSIRALNVDASDNANYGVYAIRDLFAEGLVAMNNGEEGILAKNLRLSDSTITGNDVAGDGIDIESTRRPRLKNTTCGRSEMTEPPFGDWDVCAND